MNKKQLTGSLLGLTVLFMCGVSSAATIQLTPSTQTVMVGDTFSLTVQGVDFLNGVSSGSVDLQWDETAITMTSTLSDITTSAFLNGFPIDFGTNALNPGRLEATFGTFGTVAGPVFDFFTVEFLAIAPPSVSMLSIDNVGASGDWQDGLDQDVNVTHIGASVTVVPVPAAVWLFGSGLIGMVGIARRRKTQLA